MSNERAPGRIKIKEVQTMHYHNETTFAEPERRPRKLDRTEPVTAGHFGTPGQWKVIFRAWDDDEGWFKSTKALEIEGFGVLSQVTTHESGQVAEALAPIPGVRLEPNGDGTFRMVAGIPGGSQ